MRGLPATLIPFGESFVAITLLSESVFILCCNNVPFTEREQRYRHTRCPRKAPKQRYRDTRCTSTR